MRSMQMPSGPFWTRQQLHSRGGSPSTMIFILRTSCSTLRIRRSFWILRMPVTAFSPRSSTSRKLLNVLSCPLPNTARTPIGAGPCSRPTATQADLPIGGVPKTSSAHERFWRQELCANWFYCRRREYPFHDPSGINSSYFTKYQRKQPFRCFRELAIYKTLVLHNYQLTMDGSTFIAVNTILFSAVSSGRSGVGR